MPIDVRIGVDGWTCPIKLASQMLRADMDDKEAAYRLLVSGANALKQLRDQVRDLQQKLEANR